jgi:hypothetical protein
MEGVMGIVKWLLSACWQGFLALFGVSDAQKLGRAEVQNTDLTAEVKAEKETIDVQNKVAGMSDAAVDKQLRSKWR